MPVERGEVDLADSGTLDGVGGVVDDVGNSECETTCPLGGEREPSIRAFAGRRQAVECLAKTRVDHQRPVREPVLHVLIVQRAVDSAADREAQDLDRVPRAQTYAMQVRGRSCCIDEVARVDAVERSQLLRELGSRPAALGRECVADGGHPLCYAPWVATDLREKVPNERLNDRVPGRNRDKNVLQVLGARPVELRDLAQDQPVGAVLRRRQSSHAGAPVTLARLSALSDQMQVPLTLVGLEDLGRAVMRVVVGDDHEVDARIQVIGDLGVDDVRLIVDHECHHELHGRGETYTAHNREPAGSKSGSRLPP